MLLISTLFIAILYLIIAFLQGFHLNKAFGQKFDISLFNFIPIILHGFILIFYIYLIKILNLPLLCSLVVWFIILLTCLGAFDKKSTQILSLISFPIASISLLFVYFLHNKPSPIHVSNTKEIFHVVLSTLTFSTILLSAIQAGILAIQDRSLHKHRPIFTKRLPSMESMEKFLFRLILISFLLLTAVLISSAFLFTEIYSARFTEKILLSFSTWLVLAILLIGRFMFGWRGQTVVYWTFLGTSLLLLIYFSSFLINSQI